MADHPFLVGLIGAGVGPSLTPALHMREAAEHRIAYVYRNIDLVEHGLAADDVGDLVGQAEVFGFDALNITHPCKQLVLPSLDRVEHTAARLGAVNTVLLSPGDRQGHNTDVTGFTTAMRTELPDADLSTVVMIGAGGAGAAVGYALLDLGTTSLVVVDQDPERADRLAQHLRECFGPSQVSSAPTVTLADTVAGASGLVHCTPTGMADHPGLPVDPSSLSRAQWVADIVYRPIETELVRTARSLGCRTLHGGFMAVHQAVDAFELITGIRPDPDRMLDHLHELTADVPARPPTRSPR